MRLSEILSEAFNTVQDLLAADRELRDEIEYVEQQIEREADLGGEEDADYEYIEHLENRRKQLIQQWRDVLDRLDEID